MAYLGSFDANTVEPADFSALPAGDYTALISASEWRDSKAGVQYLALTLQILEGAHQGRFLWHNLNLNHPTAQAAEIAQRELSAICRATGQMAISDSEQLHDIPVIVKVAYVPAKGEWPEKNQIKQWKPAGSAAQPALTPAPAPATKPAPKTAPAPAPATKPAPKTAPAPAPATKPAPKAAPAPAPAAKPAPAPKAPPPVAGKPWAKPAPAPVPEVATADDDDITF